MTRRRRVALAAIAIAGLALAWPSAPDRGSGRFFVDPTYHHQTLRVLDHMAAQGADVGEVLVTSARIRAGDPDGWFTAWSDLGERTLARAHATHDPVSRGQALLRAHTYLLRAEFFLTPDDPRRAQAFRENRAAFDEGLDALGVAREPLRVPYGEHTLRALHYPAPPGSDRPLLLFCGGSDTTLEELYFFLVAAARARGFPVLTFEGPGQGAALRQEHLTMTPEWEKPTAAVLDAFLAGHPRPARIVSIGLSLGGYLASRAAAFEDRIDGLVAYDVFFDGAEVARRPVPSAAFALQRVGLGGLVDALAHLRAKYDPPTALGENVAAWILGTHGALETVAALSRYDLAPVAGRIRQDVLILAGTEDQFVPVAQAERFAKALGSARSVTTRVYDHASGGSEHSQLGASTLWQADFFDWVEAHFEGAARH